jgi:trigger factor
VVSDEKVAEQLERLRTSRTTLSPVADRELVEKGDMVKVDFEGTIDGQPYPGNTGKDVTFEVTDGLLTEGNVAALEGAKVGAPKDIDFTFPADYQVEQVKGKAARFVVTPKAIQKKEVPALDDALAVALGLASLEELKTRLRTDLERAKKREVETQEREDVFKKLAEKNDITVPNALVQRGVDMMLDSALGSMARSGMDLRSLNLDWEKLRDDLRPRAEGEVRGQLLLEAIADTENIQATDEDVEQRLVTLAEEAGAPAASVRKQYAQEEARSNLRARVRDEKVLSFLKANATYAAP